MRLPSIALSLVLLTSIHLSCEKDNSDPILAEENMPADGVRFDDLKIGQRSYYLLADLEISDTRQQTHYTGDTLMLEITGREGDLFVVKETLSAGSPNRDTVITRYCNEIQYGLRLKNGVLSVERTVDCLYSNLFGELPRALPLMPAPSVRAELEGWLVEPFDDGDDDLLLYGYVEGFSFNGVSYPRLHVQVDPTLEPLDGNKNTWLYSPEFGLVRFSSYNGFANRGRLADLVILEN